MNSFKSIYPAILALAISLSVGCSQNPLHFGTDDIDAFIKNDGISISNKLNTPVYYFAVEQELAARIFWTPESKQENKIEALSEKFISYSNIGGYEKGEKILFYYWMKEDPGSEKVHNFTINTNQLGIRK